VHNRDIFQRITIGSIVFWMSAFVLIPSLLMLITSFFTRGSADFVTWTLTLQSYQKLLSAVYLWVFIKTLGLAFYVTLLCLIVAYPFAYWLSRSIHHLRVKHFLFILIIIPFWTSSLIRTYAMMAILKINGLLNTVLLFLGWIDHPLELLYNGFAVTIGLVYSLFPFMVLPLYTAFERLDDSYIDAALDLGANQWHLLTRVIIPLTQSGIAAGCIMVFLSSLGVFFIPELLGGSKDFLVGNLIKNQFLVARDWPFGSAVSVCLTLLILGLSVIYGKTGKNLNKALLS
jgi:spermidine/putrescine transport system permease protein